MDDATTREARGQLWAPWRIEYIRRSKDQDCILCSALSRDEDETALILMRGTWNFIIMNAYPYSGGHLLVAPFKHTAELADLTPQESAEHFELVKLGIALLKDVAHPDGFNVGLNLGRVAGAGIDQHLHTHVVPRWLGDTNFMPVIADTRVMSESLPSMYSRLKKALAQRLDTRGNRGSGQ
jgi:ATP adenylyltransferase